MNIDLTELVGQGYGGFWHFKGRYRAVKGSRASKKSKTAALNLIVRMMQYPEANALVVRKVCRTLRDSCYAELRWAIRRLGAERWWQGKESPLELTYLPTGQKIYFRGLDDPQKIASLAAENGSLCWMWIEEAYEIGREEDFDMLDECLRGGGVFRQVTLTFNPWNERHWLKKRFFDRPSEDVLAMTVSYTGNEFIGDEDRRLFEAMRVNNPRRYKVAGLGEWGVSEGLVYDNWREEDFDVEELPGHPPSAGRRRSQREILPVFGLDFGYTNDPSALFCGLLDRNRRRLYVFDELYAGRMTNRALFEAIERRGYRKERIVADGAEPKSIAELRELGLTNIRAARKGPDSIRSGIQRIQQLEIIVHPGCTNFLTEIGCYCWETDGNGAPLNRPAPGGDHLMDAMRYALEGREQVFSFQ